MGERTPILVTGVPRSGTTWLARLLATAPGTGLPGREPMNPRGRQYGLAGTLTAWSRLEEPTARQRRALRTAYLGLNPRVMSKYGRRQWAAPLPWTRLVVKDPFALVSIPTIARHTGATPVVVVRHPGAVLASYRRMGWSPDLAEAGHVVSDYRLGRQMADSDALSRIDASDEVAAMAAFWSALHEIALDDLGSVPAIWVAHERLAAGGPDEGRQLFARLGLTWGKASAAEWTGSDATADTESGRLHQLGRDPARVAEGWRHRLPPGDVERIERLTLDTRAKVDAAVAQT